MEWQKHARQLRCHLLHLPVELLLEVAARLNITELSRLAATHRLFAERLTTTLFRRDAQENSSTAIRFSVISVVESRTSRRKEVMVIARRNIEASLENGGDINSRYRLNSRKGEIHTTVLHIASAAGDKTLTSFLLAQGADVNALSENLLALETLGRFKDHFWDRLPLELHLVRMMKWLPIFVPMILQHEDVVRLLLKHDASAYIARHSTGGAIIQPTMLHLFATGIELSFDPYEVVQRSKNHLDDPFPVSYDTALHLAVASQNMVACRVLCQNKAQLDPVNASGLTPLLIAIQEFMENSGNSLRKQSLEILKLLTTAGADVNVLGVSPAGYRFGTPLIWTVECSEWDSQCFRGISEVLLLLVNHGAIINQRCPLTHVTLIERLVRLITQLGCDKPARDLVAFLLDRGGDINAPMARGSSLLAYAISKVDEADHVLKVVRLLLSHEAEMRSEEIPACFTAWIHCKQLRKEWIFPEVAVLRKMDETTIQTAFKRTLDEDDTAAYTSLRDLFPRYAIPSHLLLVLLRPGPHKIKFQDVAADPIRFTLVCGRHFNLVHKVIKNFANGENLSMKAAISHITLLAKKGASVCVPNKHFQTPIQYLRELNIMADGLMLKLFELREQERGEF